MTITRIWQAGAEMQHINELEELSTLGASSCSISSTEAKTGTYSFRYTAASYPRGKAFSSVNQIRAGVFLNHAGLATATSASQAIIFRLAVSGATSITLQWKGDTANLELYVGASLVASVSAASVGFSTTSTWFHVGIHAYSNASGTIKIYLDGVEILTYSGDTGTGITACYFGGRNSTNGWANYCYFDDFYIDSTVSETIAPVPSYRFGWQAVNAAGTSVAWTATGAASNYQCVDDGVPNDDTDYVSAASSGLIDYYNMASYTVPTGYVIAAVIPAAWAKKTDAGTDSEIKLGTRLSGTDSTGSAQNLATSYGPVFERQTTKPGGGTWTQSDIDSAEVKIESAGSF